VFFCGGHNPPNNIPKCLHQGTLVIGYRNSIPPWLNWNNAQNTPESPYAWVFANMSIHYCKQSLQALYFTCLFTICKYACQKWWKWSSKDKVSPGCAIQQLRPSLWHNNNVVVAFLWLLNSLGKIRLTHPLHSSSLFRVKNLTFVSRQMSKLAFSFLKFTNNETKRTSPLKRWCPAKLIVSHILTRIQTDSAYQLFSQNL